MNYTIQITTVNNYLAFYIISQNTHRVTIVRFLYQKSNWSAILRHGFPY